MQNSSESGDYRDISIIYQSLRWVQSHSVGLIVRAFQNCTNVRRNGLMKGVFLSKNDILHLLIKVFLLSQLQRKLTLFFHVHPKRKFLNIFNFQKFFHFLRNVNVNLNILNYHSVT